jgi:potassium-transporting ATPase potassium-binding subunit
VFSKANGSLCRGCFGAIERLLYRLCGVDPKERQDWKQYTVAMLVFSAITLLVTYGIERLQHILPFNPQNFGPVRADLAFNTAASFTTNTNWQAYSGESTMSYLTQMAGLAWHNFISALPGRTIKLNSSACRKLQVAKERDSSISPSWKVDFTR